MAGDPKASAQIQADDENDVAGEYLEAETVPEDAQAAADEILEAPEVPDSEPQAEPHVPGTSRIKPKKKP
ncbi:hypothetical protein EOA25_25080, partial [Mesorhizobium sp. M2A.F.Ca.ET.040.01.1.1]